MTVSYPTWWKGLRWDVTELIRDLFTYPNNEAANGLSGVRVEKLGLLPGNDEVQEHLDAGDAFLLVHRNGGTINTHTAPWVDESIVTIAGLTYDSETTAELMDYVSGVFLSFDEGGIVQRSKPHKCGLTTTSMKVPGEVVGPQLIPEQFRDDRFSPMVWAIHADIPRGLPNYRDHLGLDSL